MMLIQRLKISSVITIYGIIVQLELLEYEYVTYIILIGRKSWTIKYIIYFAEMKIDEMKICKIFENSFV